MKFRNLLVFIPAAFIALQVNQSFAVTSEALEEIRSYCGQMAQQGLPEDETKIIIEECISEQTSYLNEAPVDRELECYQEAEQQMNDLSEQGNSDSDYETLFNQCMERR